MVLVDSDNWDSVSPQIRRSMIGAKTFLHPSLLKVPWTWRLTVCPLSDEQPEQNSGLREERAKLVECKMHLCNQLTLGSPFYPPQSVPQPSHRI